MHFTRNSRGCTQGETCTHTPKQVLKICVILQRRQKQNQTNAPTQTTGFEPLNFMHACFFYADNALQLTYLGPISHFYRPTVLSGTRWLGCSFEVQRCHLRVAPCLCHVALLRPYCPVRSEESGVVQLAATAQQISTPTVALHWVSLSSCTSTLFRILLANRCSCSSRRIVASARTQPLSL